MSDLNYYEIYRKTSVGSTLMDTLDELISNRRMEPQLAIKIMQNFDKALADVISEKVKARLTFKGHLDTYRFCDDVWTFIIKDINFKMDNSQNLTADKIKIVSNNSSRPGKPPRPESPPTPKTSKKSSPQKKVVEQDDLYSSPDRYTPYVKPEPLPDQDY